MKEATIWKAPKDIAYMRWSCDSGMANPVQIVSIPPAPSNGGPINHCSTRYEQTFDTINIHTLIESCCRQTFQAQSLSSSQTTLRDANPTQHIETTHPDNVNLKLAFHKVASFHSHYLTFTLQTCHYPVHRF